jgi:predicted O-linked N-acetylglucosamine transferase (SPINDLY family)
LPDTFWCYDASYNEGLEVNELPALAGTPFTFGSLNNFCKVNAGTLSRWASVLRAVPGSRLLLHAPTSRARDGVRSHFEREGVGGDRIDFVDYQPRAEYLRTYRRIDLGLDPLPYTGQTTSLDAAWMGVPTVTQIGSTVVGRGGLSVLRNLGLPELVARSSEEFTDIAANLARDLPRLAALRTGMRARMEASPLMDAPRFARAMESAYRSMWRAWCATRTNS